MIEPHPQDPGQTHVTTDNIFDIARALLGVAADWEDDISHPVEIDAPDGMMESLAFIYLKALVRSTKPDLAKAVDILSQLEKELLR